MLSPRTTFSYLQEGIVYGPVHSRRLGQSLGLNLFPGRTRKICSLDCVYCFFQVKSSDGPEGEYVRPEEVIKALDAYLAKTDSGSDLSRIRYLTFSGNGEPTCHPDFNKIVQAVSGWREDNARDVKLAVFTNGTRLQSPEIREALLLFDKVFLKLDWGSQSELDTISRPLSPINLGDLVHSMSEFRRLVRDSGSTVDVVVQTAILTDGRSDASWKTWAEYVKTINPMEVQIYELNFPGRDFKADQHYDYHDVHRKVVALLRGTSFKIIPFISDVFYVNVDLCYAVDSLIYLPLYVADYARLFQNNGVRVHRFVSPDGDPGAVAAILDGTAQFAICDPQAGIDLLSQLRKSSRQKELPVLVAVLIDKLALWTVSNNGRVESPRQAIEGSHYVATYAHGSTANYLYYWQAASLPEVSRPKRTETVSPGEEFRYLCPLAAGARPENGCVITADLLTALFCSETCKKLRLSVSEYSSSRIGGNFLFTGLLVSRDTLASYPGAVDGVIKGLFEAVGKVYDKQFMVAERQGLKDYLLRVFEPGLPAYMKQCGTTGLMGEIDKGLKVLCKSRIYSTNGKIHLRALLNALSIRFGKPVSAATPPVRDLLRWLNKRTGSLPRRVCASLVAQMAWFSGSSAAVLVVYLGIALALSILSGYMAEKDYLGMALFWGVLCAIGAGVCVPIIGMLGVMIDGRK